MFIERTNYWAHEGKLDDLLAVRREACEVRVRIGLPAGFVCRKVGGDGPDLRWTCIYASEKDYQDDMDGRANSAEFLVVREKVGPLLRKFERHLEVLDDTCRDKFSRSNLEKLFV